MSASMEQKEGHYSLLLRVSLRYQLIQPFKFAMSYLNGNSDTLEWRSRVTLIEITPGYVFLIDYIPFLIDYTTLGAALLIRALANKMDRSLLLRLRTS